MQSSFAMTSAGLEVGSHCWGMQCVAPDLTPQGRHQVASGAKVMPSHGTGSLSTPTMPVHGNGKPCRISGPSAWHYGPWDFTGWVSALSALSIRSVACRGGKLHALLQAQRGWRIQAQLGARQASRVKLHLQLPSTLPLAAMTINADNLCRGWLYKARHCAENVWWSFVDWRTTK